MAVHIDDFMAQVLHFQNMSRRSVMDGKYGELSKHREVFKKWCEDNNLPIDFTEQE